VDGTQQGCGAVVKAIVLSSGMKLQQIRKCSPRRKALNRKGGPYYMTSPSAWFVLIIRAP